MAQPNSVGPARAYHHVVQSWSGRREFDLGHTEDVGRGGTYRDHALQDGTRCRDGDGRDRRPPVSSPLALYRAAASVANRLRWSLLAMAAICLMKLDVSPAPRVRIDEAV